MDVTTWDAMVLQEPALKRLEADVMAFAQGATTIDARTFELVWVRGFKPRVKSLVGWEARYGCLQSEHAYVIVCQRLYDLLMAPIEDAR